MHLRHWYELTGKSIRTAAEGFSDDELMTRAAALSFYSALSFAPLLVLLLWVLSALNAQWQAQLVDGLTNVIGQQGATAVKLVIDNAQQRPHLGNIVGIIGLCVTVFSASAVFAQLQSTINRVWKIRAKPGEAVAGWLSTRARAFGLLIGIAFLLIISFVVSSLIQAVIPGNTVAWQVVEAVISFGVFVIAFGAMYRILPDAQIAWRDAARGGILTALLFVGGKFVISLYIDRASVGGAYGPAGAIVVLLTWVYYASIIVLLGAELTHGLAVARGAKIRPAEHAESFDPAAQVTPSPPQKQA
ncbi:YihY/virulence factor BrkB family protein [Luteibacter aegosomatissinici]|uniref:YihY/virulence factor BrkB family protein n=1 Tax=Luteibacter aegosomatissinici TaxID=2911539 RepID=UPI001FF890D0|nr:YihY/virulence factor BrkB family protein [Luteibacter aegosomatissinici]UPG96226.1 YihY/virulence factor BrkB family protein [Luteibacter aegosomatissinici]